MNFVAAEIEELESRTFIRSLWIAIPLYGFVLGAVFGHWQRSAEWLQHDSAHLPVLEAELVDMKPQAKLYEKTVSKPKEKAAPAVSNKLSESSKTQSLDSLFDQKNKTVNESAPPLTRGPLVESAPAPKLPEYMKNRDIKTSVLIEFSIAKSGEVVPRLLKSSGDEELDALALKTAGTWVIRPALQDGHAIDSKIRLRVQFDVH